MGNQSISGASQRRLHRAYLFQNGFVLLVAFLFLSTSVSFWINPDALGRTIGHPAPFDYYWNAFYTAGSIAICYGLLSRRIAIESAGHILLVPGLLMNGIIAFDVLGFHNHTLLTFVFMGASALRGYGLIMDWSREPD